MQCVEDDRDCLRKGAYYQVISGRLGAYRALLIGINDYKIPKIPDFNTVVNNYLCRLLGGGNL